VEYVTESKFEKLKYRNGNEVQNSEENDDFIHPENIHMHVCT